MNSHLRLIDQLFDSAYDFEFFQAIRLLEMCDPTRKAVGRDADPAREAVRFRSYLGLSFPASSIFAIEHPQQLRKSNSDLLIRHDVPIMTVTHLGLYGPQGALPIHYTQMMIEQARAEEPGSKRYALRDWLDLFNHRLISLFYRAWEKYRFDVPFARRASYFHFLHHWELYSDDDDAGEAHLTGTSLMYRLEEVPEDAFTGILFSLIGLGIPQLRNRLAVTLPPEQSEEDDSTDTVAQRRAVAKIEDLALLHYAGLFSQKPPSALGLELLLQDYFRLPIRVQNFVGQWLRLDSSSVTKLPEAHEPDVLGLGVNSTIGEAVWDLMSKFRLRLGPMTYAQFLELLPDPTPNGMRKTFFLLSQMVKLYVGDEYDFDIQLCLRADEVPECQLSDQGGGDLGARLGWNTWVISFPFDPSDPPLEDAIFQGTEAYALELQEGYQQMESVSV